jgi:hypothetical protein
MKDALDDACAELRRAIDAINYRDAINPSIIAPKGRTLYIVNRSELEHMREFDRAISTRR